MRFDLKQATQKEKPWAETWMNKLIKNKQIFVKSHHSALFLKEVYGWHAKQFERTRTDHPYRNADRNVLLRDCEKRLIIGLEQSEDPQAKKIVEKSQKRTRILESILEKQNSTIGYSTFQCFVDTVKLSWYAPTKKEIDYFNGKIPEQTIEQQQSNSRRNNGEHTKTMKSSLNACAGTAANGTTLPQTRRQSIKRA